MGSERNESTATILAIGIFKLLKGLILLATGIGALSLLHKDVASTVQHWVELLRVDPDSQFIHRFIGKLLPVTSKQLKEISAGTFFYAALLLTEGFGLLFRQTWAEYFTVITTALLIPLEVYEIMKRFTFVRVGVLVINVAIVVYLVWRVAERRRRKKPHHRLKPARRSSY